MSEKIVPKNVKNYNTDTQDQVRVLHGVASTSQYPGKNGLEDCLSDKRTQKTWVDKFTEMIKNSVLKAKNKDGKESTEDMSLE